MRYTEDGTPVTDFSVAARQASARAQPSGGVEGAGRGLPDRLEGACFRYRKQERSTARTGS